MAITVTKTNNDILVVVQDGVNDDETTSLNILGRNYIGYADKIADNFLHLLENFASNVAPTAPITGQIWYDTSTNLLQVFKTGVGWKVLSFSAASASQPTNPVIGDIWFDTGNQQLKAWTGADWLVIGPTTPSGFGFTGFQVETIQDTLAGSHTIGKEFVDGNLITIISQDAEFTPANVTLSSSFGNLKPGYNISGSLPAKYWNGLATNSEKLNGLSSTSFLRANTPALTTSSLTVQSDTGLTIGQGLDCTINVNDIHVQLKNNSTGGNISLVAGNTTALIVNGSSFSLTASSTYGNALLANANAFSSFALTTRGYVDAAVGGGALVLLRDGSNTIQGNITPDLNQARDFGSSSLRFGTIWSGNVNVNVAVQSQTGTFTSATQSTSSITGAVVITGGLGIGANAYVGGNLVVLQNTILEANATTRSLLPVTNNTHDLGAGGNIYRTIYANSFSGTSTSSLYADLAEIYKTDYQYEPGTVVCFGGENEITISTLYADTRIAGVISTKPGFIMNTDGSGLPVALKGKVPCKVTGTIFKGSFLVSSTIPGVACAVDTFIGGAIIGKSLENANFENGEVGIIQIAVGSV